MSCGAFQSSVHSPLSVQLPTSRHPLPRGCPDSPPRPSPLWSRTVTAWQEKGTKRPLTVCHNHHCFSLASQHTCPASPLINTITPLHPEYTGSGGSFLNFPLSVIRRLVPPWSRDRRTPIILINATGPRLPDSGFMAHVGLGYGADYLLLRVLAVRIAFPAIPVIGCIICNRPAFIRPHTPVRST